MNTLQNVPPRTRLIRRALVASAPLMAALVLTAAQSASALAAGRTSVDASSRATPCHRGHRRRRHDLASPQRRPPQAGGGRHQRPAASKEFDLDTFESIEAFGGAGNDTFVIDEAYGVFTDTKKTTLDGEAGDDTLVGGSGSERLVGAGGDDLVVDGGSADETSGGAATTCSWGAARATSRMAVRATTSSSRPSSRRAPTAS
jgi:hypothetical protein